MSVKIGHAIMDERSQSHGGKAGDQTGKEVVTRNWYLNNKGWRLLRHKNFYYANRIAEAMEHACKNNHIGYDQYQRDTLLTAAAIVGYDPGAVTVDCECDCSALVRVCIAYAYGRDVCGEWKGDAKFTTATMCEFLLNSGDFIEKSAKEAKTDKYVRRGDILCTPIQGHTVVVLDDGPKAVYEMDEIGYDNCPFTKPATTISRKKNSSGEPVKWIQWHINKVQPGDPPLKIDGSFGAKTEAAVKAFQKYAGIKVDGIVGPITCNALICALDTIS